MLARLRTLSLSGLDVHEVLVEVDLTPGLPFFDVVGLPDTSVKESRERVKASLRNAGFTIPPRRTIVNLAPADTRKVGPSFDLPIALGVLAASGYVPFNRLSETFFVGELALDGSLRAVKGALCLAYAPEVKRGHKLVMPSKNQSELGLAIDRTGHVLLASHLRDVVGWLCGQNKLASPKQQTVKANPASTTERDLSSVVGQESACRALEIAAAGRHNILFVGPPGVGKTILASCLPGILPALSTHESSEVVRIRSLTGEVRESDLLARARPFRAPHHSATIRSLLGGGVPVKPGEISLAHNGVLFLDEFAEFRSDVLAALRQPLEEGYVFISRHHNSIRFPADVQLVAATNPCPCGWLGAAEHRCWCSDGQITRYRRRLSGPVLDRIDIKVEMQPVREVNDLLEPPRRQREHSSAVRERVAEAWQRQRARVPADSGLPFANSRLSPRAISEFCGLNREAASLLRTATAKLSLSARGVNRILRVARTIADLTAEEAIRASHVGEALSFRQYPEGGLWCPHQM